MSFLLRPALQLNCPGQDLLGPGRAGVVTGIEGRGAGQSGGGDHPPGGGGHGLIQFPVPLRTVLAAQGWGGFDQLGNVHSLLHGERIGQVRGE